MLSSIIAKYVGNRRKLAHVYHLIKVGGTTFKLLEKLVERAFKHVIRAMDLDELAGLSHKLACGVFAPASEFADIVNAEQPIALSGTPEC